ncbi:hypothetical protein D915_010236, partial [Fasciola hepatica]
SVYPTVHIYTGRETNTARSKDTVQPIIYPYDWHVNCLSPSLRTGYFCLSEDEMHCPVACSISRWFGKGKSKDLGPMVSQVITYQSDDKRYLALGPGRNRTVSTRDLTGRWIGITLSEYQNYMGGKYLEKATYLLWDETDTFNGNLSGALCSQLLF